MWFRKKQDIWAVGILALELSYGDIRVRSRQEFLRVIYYILNHNGLPRTWLQLRTNATNERLRHRVLSNPRLSPEFCELSAYVL